MMAFPRRHKNILQLNHQMTIKIGKLTLLHYYHLIPRHHSNFAYSLIMFLVTKSSESQLNSCHVSFNLKQSHSFLDFQWFHSFEYYSYFVEYQCLDLFAFHYSLIQIIHHYQEYHINVACILSLYDFALPH